MNSRRYKNNKSGYKGVCWDKHAKKWVASIYFQNKHIHLGNFFDPVQAALAYDSKARELFGEFLKLIFNPEKI